MQTLRLNEKWHYRYKGGARVLRLAEFGGVNDGNAFTDIGLFSILIMKIIENGQYG